MFGSFVLTLASDPLILCFAFQLVLANGSQLPGAIENLEFMLGLFHPHRLTGQASGHTDAQLPEVNTGGAHALPQPFQNINGRSTSCPTTTPPPPTDSSAAKHIQCSQGRCLFGPPRFIEPAARLSSKNTNDYQFASSFKRLACISLESCYCD